MIRKPWILYLPESTRARPLAMFLISLCLISGLPAVMGAPPSDRIQAVMHPVIVRSWGLVLVVGSGILLYSLMRKAQDGIHARRLLSTEKLGLRILSVGATFYAVTVIVAVGLNVSSIFTAGIILWFALWCEVRVAVINLLLKPWSPPDRLPDPQEVE